MYQKNLKKYQESLSYVKIKKWKQNFKTTTNLILVIYIVDNTDLDNSSQINYTNDHEKFQNMLQETDNQKKIKRRK